MRKLIGLIVLIGYFVGFTHLNSAEAFGPIAKVEIMHVHETLASHDHPHSHQSSESESSSKKSESQIPHSHEIFVCSFAFVVPSTVYAPQSTGFAREISYEISSEQPHDGPSLHGIFRPPIV